MAILDPILAILDETDSGLDIDAMKIVANGVNNMRSPERLLLLLRIIIVCWNISNQT